MGKVTTPLTQDYGHGYQLAFRLAIEALTEIEDIEQQCHKCGARFSKQDKTISLDYLNRTYLITYPEANVTCQGSEDDVAVTDKILLLHYLTQAKGTPLSNQLISFKELPGTSGYFPTFYNRAIKPLVIYFGNDPERMLEMAEAIDGVKAEYGDVSATIYSLKMIPLTLVLWKGDAEFSAEGTIMFDRTIVDYLPGEDIIVLCQNTSWRLVKLLKSSGDDPKTKAGT